jgi:hypothetical protein
MTDHICTNPSHPCNNSSLTPAEFLKAVEDDTTIPISDRMQAASHLAHLDVALRVASAHPGHPIVMRWEGLTKAELNQYMDRQMMELFWKNMKDLGLDLPVEGSA